LANIDARDKAKDKNNKTKKRFFRYRFGGSASAVSAFKVLAKSGLFFGEMTADDARDNGAKRAFDSLPLNSDFNQSG
jgi:hypothetical protein